MKQILPLTMISAFIAIPVWAQNLPENPPKQLSIQIRFHGTTEDSGRDHLRVLIDTNGIYPANILALRPTYDDRGMFSINSPRHKGKLDDDDFRKIYTAARSVILNHRVGEEPAELIADGETVEITVGSFDRRITATFDHSSASKSKECETLLTLVNAQLPMEFRSKSATLQSK